MIDKAELLREGVKIAGAWQDRALAAEQQRDELLAALEWAVAVHGADYSWGKNAVSIIARIKGSQP